MSKKRENLRESRTDKRVGVIVYQGFDAKTTVFVPKNVLSQLFSFLKVLTYTVCWFIILS